MRVDGGAASCWFPEQRQNSSDHGLWGCCCPRGLWTTGFHTRPCGRFPRKMWKKQNLQFARTASECVVAGQVTEAAPVTGGEAGRPRGAEIPRKRSRGPERKLAEGRTRSLLCHQPLNLVE